MTSNRNVLIAALAGLVVVLAVLLIRARGPSPAVPIPAPPAPVAAAPITGPGAATGMAAGAVGGDDSALAMNSTDPFFTGFIGSFKSSSVASCRKTLAAKLQTVDPAALARMDDVCGCAADRTAATITMGEARASSASAFAGDTATNPAMKAIADRFAEAGKACMADKLGGAPPSATP